MEEARNRTESEDEIPDMSSSETRATKHVRNRSSVSHISQFASRLSIVDTEGVDVTGEPQFTTDSPGNPGSAQHVGKAYKSPENGARTNAYGIELSPDGGPMKKPSPTRSTPRNKDMPSPLTPPAVKDGGQAVQRKNKLEDSLPVDDDASSGFGSDSDSVISETGLPPR